ncbi:MAG: tetratricopeptide repeat protein, partial [Spirochaetota bacterium]
SRGEAGLAAQTFGFIIANGLDGTASRLWRARALKEMGDYKAALQECETAASYSPDDPSIGWLRAGLLFSAGRRAEALKEFARLGMPSPDEEAVPADAGSLEILRASAAFKEGRWKEAAAASLALLRAQEGGQKSTGLNARATAGLHALASASLRELGLISRAKVEAEKAILADPSAPELRISYALILWDMGAYQKALEVAEAARKNGADQGMVDYLSALCKSRLGLETEKVLAQLQSILRSRTRLGEAPDSRLLFAIGESLYRLERPDLALGWFDKVLELTPDHELSLLYRISVAESLDDKAARGEACEAYLDRYPNNNEIRREYAEMLAAAENWERVALLLEEGLIWTDSSSGSRKMLARALRETARFRDSAVLYRDLLIAEPENGELLMALCLCLEKDGKTAYALALLDKAPFAAMERAGPWIVKGILAEKLGRMESAIDSFRAASEREPRLERPWRELSRIYAERGLDTFAAEAKARAEAEADSIPRPRRPN